MEAATVFELMERRANLIEQGKLGYDKERVAHHNRHRRTSECRTAIHMTTMADKSDPFVRHRVSSHLAQGLTEPDDYAVRFVKERGVSVIGCALPPGEMYFGKQSVKVEQETDVIVPRNRSVPCI